MVRQAGQGQTPPPPPGAQGRMAAPFLSSLRSHSLLVPALAEADSGQSSDCRGPLLSQRPSSVRGEQLGGVFEIISCIMVEKCCSLV